MPSLLSSAKSTSGPIGPFIIQPAKSTSGPIGPLRAQVRPFRTLLDLFRKRRTNNEETKRISRTRNNASTSEEPSASPLGRSVHLTATGMEARDRQGTLETPLSPWSLPRRQSPRSHFINFAPSPESMRRVYGEYAESKWRVYAEFTVWKASICSVWKASCQQSTPSRQRIGA